MPLNKGQLNISKICFLSIFYQSLLNYLYKLQTTFFYDRLLIVNFLTLIAIFTTFSIKKALSREINRFSELLQKEGFSIMKTSVDLPKATKKRITQLLQILKTWESKKITSVEISNLTGWKNSLIRHDFWYLRNFQNQKAKDNSDLLKDSDNFFGVSNGYNVEKLKELIFEVLGGSPFSALEKSECKEKLYKNCCLVGISNFGETFLHSSTVQDSSFLLKAGFDTNLNLVEITSSPFPLFHTNDMSFVIKKEMIEYAILTVKDKDANLMAQRLVNYGIKGIVNMTNVILSVPQNVKVINLSVVNSLMELSIDV